MTIEARKDQILRVRAQGLHPELSEKLTETLRVAVLSTVKTVMEAALREEMSEFLSRVEGKKPQRSGSYTRGLNTQYGAIVDLTVPKLREQGAVVGNLGALPAESGEFDGLALLFIRDGPVAARSARGVIFSIEPRNIRECRESHHSSSPAKISRKTSISNPRNPGYYPSRWSLGGHSVCDRR